MGKLDTVSLQGKDYALVPVRLKAFREANPHSSVETEPTVTGDTVIFKAIIKADKNDPNSQESTGHSYGKLGQAKAFEKLETQAVGRALALLGYLNNGEVATTEEMVEFNDYKLEKYESAIQEAKSVDQLMTIFKEMDSNNKKYFTEALGVKKKELQNATTV